MTKPQKLLLLSAVASIAIWAIPIARYAILPLTYLNTHFHELAHALMALATGGIPDYILVNADGSGLTPISGGNAFLVASAGYPGTAVLGSLLIIAGRKPDSAQKALKAFSILLALSLILFVRGDWVGIFSAIFWIPTLWLISANLKGENLQFAVQFLGVQMCFTAAQSLLSLTNISISSNTPTDASILQEYFLLPPIFWAVLWVVISATCCIVALNKAWNHR